MIDIPDHLKFRTILPADVLSPSAEKLLKYKPQREDRRVVVVAVESNSPFLHKPRDVFRTAAAASKSIGLSTSGLWAALHDVPGAPATVRGITFQYFDDFKKAEAQKGQQP